MPSEQMQLSICSCRESLEPSHVQLLGDLFSNDIVPQGRPWNGLVEPKVEAAGIEPAYRARR